MKKLFLLLSLLLPFLAGAQARDPYQNFVVSKMIASKLDTGLASKIFALKADVKKSLDSIRALAKIPGPVGPQGPAGASIVGPQGPQGIAGQSITGPQGPAGSDANVTATNIGNALGYTPAAADYVIHPLAIVGNIDFKISGGTTALFTVPAGKRCVVTDIIVRATTASGVSVVASGSVGTDTKVFGNIMTSAGFAGLTATGKVYKAAMSGTYALANAGEVITGKVTVPAVATGSFICEVTLIGYLY